MLLLPVMGADEYGGATMPISGTSVSFGLFQAICSA